VSLDGGKPEEEKRMGGEEEKEGDAPVRRRSGEDAEGIKMKKNSSSPLLLPFSSQLRGFIPTGQYASAIAVVGNKLLVANGKGTGVENSSLIVDNSGFAPNAPNVLFPPKGNKQGGQ